MMKRKMRIVKIFRENPEGSKPNSGRIQTPSVKAAVAVIELTDTYPQVMSVRTKAVRHMGITVG
jgi:hypothetical protein